MRWHFSVSWGMYRLIKCQEVIFFFLIIILRVLAATCWLFQCNDFSYCVCVSVWSFWIFFVWKSKAECVRINNSSHHLLVLSFFCSFQSQLQGKDFLHLMLSYIDRCTMVSCNMSTAGEDQYCSCCTWRAIHTELLAGWEITDHYWLEMLF